MMAYGKGRTVVAIAGWSGRVYLGSVPCSSARGSVNEDQEWNVWAGEGDSTVSVVGTYIS
jgi:hypothetical protein